MTNALTDGWLDGSDWDGKTRASQEEVFCGLLCNLIDESHDAALDGTPHEDINTYAVGQIRGIEAKHPGFIDYLRRVEPALAARVQIA